MTKTPENCKCIWTNHDKGGSIFIAMPDCPARPHPRIWRVENDESK